MVKTFMLSAALLAVSIAPALAQSACMEPIAPAAIDGATASEAQMKAAHDDVMTFIHQSDDYQACLFKELSDLKAQTAKNDKNADPEKDPAVIAKEADVNAKANANQILKQKVGDEYNAAVGAFKAKHPG